MVPVLLPGSAAFSPGAGPAVSLASGAGRPASTWRRSRSRASAPTIQLGHGELVAVHLHLGADPRQLPERGEHVPGHRLVRALGQLHAGLLGELVQVQQPVHLELAVAQLGRAGLLDVVLVLDLADQLLDQVLQGHDA